MTRNNTDEPDAYHIGSVPFIHTNIYLDSRPLIPRTETEYWVSEVIEKVKQGGIREPRILDLCAGSGCIGVAILKEIPDAQVDFAEVDGSHHQTIRKNLIMNNIDSSRAHIVGGDLFENIHHKYDFILSNPPYIDKTLGRVEESVRVHEPALALYGGKEGFEIIDRILKEAPKYLNPGGTMYIEHEPEQVERLMRYPSYHSSHKDQFGTLRYSQFFHI